MIPTIGMDTADQVRENILKLQEAMLSAHPSMPVLLQTIHRQLKADPAIVTVLAEDEIAGIIGGLIVHTGTVLVQAEKDKKAKKGTLKNLGMDDI